MPLFKRRDTPQPQIFSDEQTFSDEQIRAKAYSLWEARGGSGASSDDWQKAIEVLKQEIGSKKLNGIRKGLSWVNQPLIWVEKKVIEPTAHWCDRSDIFRISVKVSPLLEAFGVILIPVAIWWFTQTATQQKENQDRQKRAQESVKTYLNQLTTVYLDGDLTKSDGLRRVTRASTLALLSDPDLDGSRKGQTIQYLIELELVQAKTIEERKQGKQQEKVIPPLISLSGADLSFAKLSFADLSFADLSGADLRNADLNGANLSYANLKDAFVLTGISLQEAKLCETNLPKSSRLNPDRDCKELGIRK